jgi:hypothetical protein
VRQHLDGDALIELHVTRRDDDAHAARGEHTIHTISPRQDIAFADGSITIGIDTHPIIESKGM